MVSGSSGAFKSGSGFLEMSPNPLIPQHMAPVGERILPTSSGYSHGFFSTQYASPLLDLTATDQWPRFTVHVGRSMA